MFFPLMRRLACGVCVIAYAICCGIGFAQESAKATGATTGTVAAPNFTPIMDRLPITLEPGKRLPNQGGFRNGQDMYAWLNGAGDIWWDGDNPISAPAQVEKFVKGQTASAMEEPRPDKVKLYMQGYIPRLPKYTYQQAADNDPGFRADWIAMAKICVDAGYTDCVFGSSETQTDSKRWMPSAEDITSGRWEKAWMNMVDNVRSVMPDAKFAFVPFTANQTGERGMTAKPDNGILEKDLWYVAKKDKAGRPYMDFWGSTIYFGTHPAKVGYPKPVTKEIIEQCMEAISTPVKDCHTNWGFMGNYQYAKEKGIKMVIGEIGMMDRLKTAAMGMGDQPYAIDLLTKFMVDCSDNIEFVCWFNLRGGKMPNCLDGKSSMPNAAKRVQELWGPDSPYRQK